MPETSDALDALRSYARVWLQLAAAGSVSVYVPASAGTERDILVHEGELPPVPELADLTAAAALAQSAQPAGPAPLQLPSALAEGVLLRVPPGWLREGAPHGVERRRPAATPGGREQDAIWLGLRFEAGTTGSRLSALAEPALRAFLGLGAAVAAGTRAARRAQQDPVTGLPERREFQQELDSALAHAADSGRSLVLLLLGPDDFGWVNERLDRRAGDRVLAEIAGRLRAAVRRHDHVARYGGAMFTLVLRDATLEGGRAVAANVLQRLAQEPYQGRLFRLEFSAGIALWDGEAAVDAHELVRRADQALCAAKRGESGHVRVWEKGSDVESAGSLDRLQGIFTGDKGKDYRNMRLLLDTVAAVAGSTDPEHLARSFTERLCFALHARRALVVQRTAAGLEVLAGCDRVTETLGPLQLTPLERQLLERACLDRDLVTERRPGSDEAMLCAVPLRLEDRSLGGLLLEAAARDLSIESSDRLFLEALASEMAVALDRARLAERERQREREEKERLEAEVHDLRRVMGGSRLTYASAAMESLLATVRRIARTDTTVLITGESGTGKELLAHVLHQLSPRHEQPLVVVDCSAIAPTLIESELFGHERGAFTGAHARNPGRLAQAHGATVFLDEIGELPLDLQSKLLRFVQEKQFTPVGGVAPRVVDVRIVAATNVDLRARVAQGRFREDLYHRLNVVRLHVPPLRERRDDVVHLANAFLKQFAALYRRPAQAFTPEAERALFEHPWPGNVRELQNVVLTSVLFGDGPEIGVRELHLHGSPRDSAGLDVQAPATAAAETPDADGDAAPLLRQALAREVSEALVAAAPVPLGRWLGEDLVLAADRLAGGIHRRASDLLGIPETTYRRQLQHARRARAGGLAVRTANWSAVERLLDDVIRSRPAGKDACAWAETCLLAEIDAAVPGNVRMAAALVGVTEPTVLRRFQRLRRS